MSDEFDYEKIADEVVKEYGQDDGFKQRFIGFYENAMEGVAEDSDLERLIESVELSEEEKPNEA